jgi:hypothetical protein
MRRVCNECQKVVEQLLAEKQELEHENQVLRVSAATFGELAERLNAKLREGRKIEASDARGAVAARVRV